MFSVSIYLLVYFSGLIFAAAKHFFVFLCLKLFVIEQNKWTSWLVFLWQLHCLLLSECSLSYAFEFVRVFISSFFDHFKVIGAFDLSKTLVGFNKTKQNKIQEVACQQRNNIFKYVVYCVSFLIWIGTFSFVVLCHRIVDFEATWTRVSLVMIRRESIADSECTHWNTYSDTVSLIFLDSWPMNWNYRDSPENTISVSWRDRLKATSAGTEIVWLYLSNFGV